MAATVRVSIWTGASPTAANAESGIKFNRDESQTGTSAPVPRPVATGTAFSWPKVLALEVTATDSTSLSNRRFHRASGLTTGITGWYRDDGSTYTRPTANAAADSGTNDSTPSGYSAWPSSATAYDTASVSAGSTGRNGDYMSLAVGVSNLYTGGGNSNLALPNLVWTYDES